MVSTLTGPGGEATLEALARGATDYVTKPTKTVGMAAAQAEVREQLVPRIAALFPRVAMPAGAPARMASRLVAEQAGFTLAAPRAGLVDVVAIGVSTGGPNALAVVLPSLPANLAVPIVIVQHMPPVFTKLLADRLAARCPFPVAEGVQGAAVEPGEAWLAPGDFHMEVERHGLAVRLRLHQGPQENSCRPAVDVLFRSVAAVYGPRVLAVVLTGMGQDGFLGCGFIRQAGGQVIAQDEATSVVWGMPGHVANGGLAEKVLPIEHVGPEIVRRLAVGRAVRSERRRPASGTGPR